MSRLSLALTIFGLFALGLPLWAMQNNEYGGGNTHLCIGECYENWKDQTGGVVQIAAAQAAAQAESTPEERGAQAYLGCVACHGAGGEGGVGPALAGSGFDELVGALQQYRNGETRGSQSSLMWSQAKEMTDGDMEDLAAYILTF